MSAEANQATIERLYEAFGQCNGAAMTACYAPGAHFRDPAFGDLEGEEIGAMWRMLTGRATDLKIELHEHEADEETGSAHWIARYTFSTGRPVVNDIQASFRFAADGRIADHVDEFDFRRWAKQALGPSGHLVALLPPLRAKARAKALDQLATFTPRQRPAPASSGRFRCRPNRRMRTYVRMRWDEQRVENDLRLPGVGDGTVVRTFDAPEAMGINFHEVRARSALNHVPGGRYGFSWTINPYRGCTHACVFCFARRTHTYLDLDAGRDFEREIVVKVNVPELLRAELARPSWKRELVALGTNTDPYQWVESRYRMMPEILEALEAARDAGLGPDQVAAGDARRRDLRADGEEAAGLGQPLGADPRRGRLAGDRAAHAEPRRPPRRGRRAAPPRHRLRRPDRAADAGHQRPPRAGPADRRARQRAGATFLGGVALHLRDEVKDVFFAWLEPNAPTSCPATRRSTAAAPTCGPSSASTPPEPSTAGAAAEEARPSRSASRTGGDGRGDPLLRSCRRRGGSPAVTGPARQTALF